MKTPVKDERNQIVYFTDGVHTYLADALTGDFYKVTPSGLPLNMRQIPPGATNARDVNFFAPKA
jgi:hypothetical protein